MSQTASTSSEPDYNKPPLSIFVAHGVEFVGQSGDEVFGTCPFTGKSKKFYVNAKKAVWDSKTLGAGGTVADFLARISAQYTDAMTPALWRDLADDRRLPLEAFKPWGIGWTGDAYALPTRNASGDVVDIRTHRLGGKLLSTKGCHTSPLGLEHLRQRPAMSVHLCEGEWDAIAWTHLLWLVKRRKVVVLGLPGAGVFKEEWASLLSGRTIRGLYDNDEAGRNGDVRVFERLSRTAAKLTFLHWPDGTPEGHDIRDEVVEALKNGTPDECWNRLKQQWRSEPRVSPESDADGDAGDDPDNPLFRDYVFSVATKRFIHIETLQQYDKEQFDALHAEQHPLRQQNSDPASVAFLNSAAGRKVAKPTYRPGAERFVAEDDADAINLYRPSPLEPAEGDITPWLEHARYLLPDKRVRITVLNWMAYLLQHPDRKMNWALFLGGTQGNGKDALFEPIRLALGDDNTAIISPDDLSNGWTDWLNHSKLVVVQEFAVFDKKPLMNRLKTLITSPPTKLRINTKFVPQYYIPNLASFVFFSNFRDALTLEQDDRRFFVYWSPADPRAPDYYKHLYDWMRAHAAAVFHWLLQRDLSKFDPVGHAPMTADKAEVIRESASVLEQYLRAQWEAQDQPLRSDLVVIKDDVLDRLPPHVGKASQKTIAAVLRKLGAVETPKQLRLSNGARPRVWAVRRPDVYEGLSEAELTKAYERQRRSGAISSVVSRQGLG